MIRRTSTILLVSLLCVALLATAGFAAQQKGRTVNVKKTAASNALAYSFAPESHTWGSSSVEKGRVPLGTYTSTAANASPGVTIGYTYYDYQHNCSMGRMIETGPHSGETGPTIVHMGWMHLPDSVFASRTYMYNAYKSTDHTFAGAYRLHDPDAQYSGYVNVDVTPDNRALVGGHCDEKGPIPYQTHIHFDACPACELFDTYERVPDSVAGYGQTSAFEAIWPKFFFQFGTDTVLHVAAEISDVTMLQAVMYFRKVGYEGSTNSEWDYPPYVVDSVPCIAQDITGQRMGDRVCMIWFANPPYQEPDCDTCSGSTVYDGLLIGQMDNDIYYQVSDDQGATWNPRVNITNVGIGQAAYKAYCDGSALFDQDGYLHILWHAAPWPNDLCIDEGGGCFDGDLYYDKCRLMHWSENIPYIRTLADHTYEPSDSCGAPAWAMTVAKMTLSECDGKLYAIWGQFNDMPGGIENDCSEWGYSTGTYFGATNADIWVSVSSDAGMTWDAQRNLTNSYTPHCDPHGGDDCQSDYWPSMSRWGREVQTGEDWSMAEVVDPSGGSSPTDFYLDISFVNDLDAGGIVQDEGTWTNCPMKWFRMPCVEPVPNPLFIAEWNSYGDPNYNLPGEEKSVDLDFENAGNVALTYTIDVIEDNGPAGWLGVSGFSGSVPSGLSNIETGTVILNAGGIIGVSGNYYGRLHVEGNDPANLPADIEIELIVADTICPMVRDVVNTNCLALSVNNMGNMGREGYGGQNMDYVGTDFSGPDCDTTALVYMYDGSSFLGRLMGDDTTFTMGSMSVTMLDDEGFRPQCGEIATRNCLGGEVFQSGTHTTQDSTVAFAKVYVAPSDDCEFIIAYTKVWSFDGAAHDDLMIGEFIDWDVPWDYHADDEDQTGHTAVNTGGTDGPRNLLYQQGYESYGANGEDTLYPFNCQYNDERFAGSAFIESYLNGGFRMGAPYGGFIGENDSTVYPATVGIMEGMFWQDCIVSGLRGSDSTEDLHAAMVYEPYLDLGVTDVYEAVTVLATIQQGTLADLQQVIDDAEAWYTGNGGMAMFADLDGMNGVDLCEGCCQNMGDFNHDAGVNPLDAVAFVNWMWRGGADPVCEDECDVNCSGGVDPLDAVYIVNYFWRGGAAPCDCSELP